MKHSSVKDLAQALFEEAGDALFLFDPETDQLQDVNPLAERLSGYPRAELLRLPATYLFRFGGQGGKGGHDRLRQAATKTVDFHAQDGFFLRNKQDGVWVPVNLTVTRLHVHPKTLALITARDVREQHEAHARLQAMEAELRRVLTSVSDCLWSAEWPAEGTWRYRYLSPVVEALTGRPPAFFTTNFMSWQSVVHPEDWPRWLAALQRLRDGQPTQGEFRVVWPDGSVRWLRESVRVTPKPAARSLQLDGVLSDMTERKQAEERLLQERQLLRSLIENLPEAIYVKDSAGRYLLDNGAHRGWLGVGREEDVLGKTVYDFFPPEVARGYDSDDRAVLAAGRPVLEREEMIRDQQGQEHYTASTKVPLRDSAGEVVGLVCITRDVTENRRAREELRRSEERLRRAVLDAPFPIMIHAEGGEVLLISKTWTELTGYTHEDIPTIESWVGKAFPQRKEQALAGIAELFGRTERVRQGEGVLTTRTGEARVWEFSSAPLGRLPDGRRLVISMANDVTERKKAEEERDRFFTLSLEMLCIATLDGYFKRLNPAWERVLGWSLAELTAQPYLNFVHPDDRPATEVEMARLASGQDTVSFENRYRCKDGSYRWIVWTATPYRDQGLVYAAAHDITARKQMGEELAQERNLLRTLMDNLPDHIFVKDPASRFVVANASTLRTLGARSLAEVVGKSDFDFLPLERARQYHADEREVVTSGRALLDHEELLVDHAGQRRWLLTTKVPLRDRAGKVIGLVGISHDISDRKRMEEEWQRARDVAEAASRAKSEFLAKMSHEIRTPMNGIIGMTDLALETELNPEQRDYLETVKGSAELLLRVINDILDFSKIEAGKLQLEPAPFRLRDSLADTVRTLGLRAQQKGLELACQVAPEVPDELVGDLGRLRQVLVNLVGNAIKFTDRGEVILRVGRADKDEGGRMKDESAVLPHPSSLILHPSSGCELSFEVSDTGIGIPPEKQRAIFEPFEQVDGSVSRRFGGTGLGLAISSQLVQLMGGRLGVESAPGRGSTFHFRARFGLTAGPAGGEEPPDVHGLRVLAVDDNLTHQGILAEMLTNWRMRPTVVGSARAALEELRRARAGGEPYPLVLLDSAMPDTDGFGAAEQIRSEPGLAGAVIMMLASGGKPGAVERCREAGVDAILMKPLKQSELLNTILDVLSARHGGRAAGERGAARRASQAEAQGPRPAWGPLRVLLAEDNAVNQRLAVRILEKHGHAVAVATNGREALSALERGEFDLVLMDVQMPELDGMEATMQLRAREGGTGRHTPVIALTAHAMKGDRERCLGAGMDGYVTKPILPKELFEVMDEVLRAHPPARPAGPPDPAEAFDRDEALERVGGDARLLRELADMFLAEAPRWARELGAAVTEGDAEGVRRLAHTVKGAVGTFGARQAMELARRLEQLAKKGELAGAEQAWAELREALWRLQEALRAFEAAV
jgi:two-component system, sensor histidine kinase and response regulator